MNIVDALMYLRPNESWSLTGDSYDGLVWHDETPKPTLEELESVWPQAEAAKKWHSVRRERDKRLAACDWTQVADAPFTDAQKYAWAAYRQTLRNIPQDFATPDEVVWPEAP